jgi:hypothetical protein
LRKEKSRVELNRMKKEIEERIITKPQNSHEKFERQIDPTAPF